MIIAFLGPDGSGKTTIINSLLGVLKAKKIEPRLFHFRPRFFRVVNTGIVVSNPHLEKPRNKIVSYLKLLFYTLDYLSAYIYLKNTKKLVLFDRYFYDLLVDPTRFRYSGNMNIVKFLIKIIPKPDIIFVLYTEAKQMHARKNEIAPNEIERQINLLNILFRGKQSSYFLDTGADLEVTLDNVINVMNNNKLAV